VTASKPAKPAKPAKRPKAKKPRKRRARKPFCVRGHPATPDNLYTRPNGHQNCALCRAAGRAAYRERRSVQAAMQAETTPRQRAVSLPRLSFLD
jgi:hypothetical protein